MSIQRSAAAFLVAGLLLPASVSAQVGIGPRISFVRGDVETQTSSDRYTGGVLRARMSPRTALELALDWRTVINQSLTERTRDYPFQGSLLVYPGSSAVAPYLLGGIGWYSQKVEALDTQKTVLSSTTTRKFGYHLGFGGELRFGRHAAAHVDYRYTFMRVDETGETDTESSSSGGGFRIPLVSSLTDKLGVSHKGSMWTAGLTVYF